MDFSSINAPPDERKPYWQVVDEYRQFLAQNPDLQVDLPGFSRSATEAGLGDYTEGQNDDFIRRGQANIERALHHFGGRDPGGSFSISELLGGSPEGINLPAVTGGLVRSGAEHLGAGPELASKLEHVGQSFPRMAVDIGVGGTVGGPWGMAALSGLGAYGETGKIAPSLLAGATARLFPEASKWAGNKFLKIVGAPTLAEAAPNLLHKATKLLSGEAAEKFGETLVPGSLAQGIGRFGAQQAGMFGLAETSELAGTAISGEDNKWERVKEQFTPSSLAATALGQIPFTIADVASPHQRPTRNLENQLLPPLKERFAETYSKVFEKQYGKPPEPGQVKGVIDKLLSSNPRALLDDQPAAGQVLASMGIQPVKLDLERPVKTSEGEWNMGEAIESVKNRASNLIKAQSDLSGFSVGQKDDHRVYAALRQLEGQKLTKQELTRQAAHVVVETMRGDQRNLGRISPEYVELEQSEAKHAQKEQQQLDTEALITSRITPKLPDGSKNDDYDPQLALRITLVSGDPEHRMELGIDRPIVMSRGQGTGDTIPLETSIIDKVRGLLPKHGEVDEQQAEVANLQARVVDLDTQIKAAEGQGELFDNPELADLRATREALQQALFEATSMQEPTTVGKTQAAQLTAEATFAARNAALKYPGTLDIRDPDTVRSFYEYVKSAITTAERGFYRRRATQEPVFDDSGRPVTFATEAEANVEAARLNSQREDKTTHKFFVDTRKDKDGKIWNYTIFKQNYYATFGEGKPKLADDTHEVGEGKPDFESVKEAFEEGIGEDTLSQFQETLKTFEQDQVLKELQDYAQLPDPAVREALKDALVQNVIDYAGNDRILSDAVIKSLLRAEVGEVSIRQPSIIRARIVKFLEFMRDGGEIRLKYTKEGNRLRVVGEGDIEGLNNYMGELGFSDKRAKWALNTASTGGLNFFEQYHLISKMFQKEFVDIRKQRMSSRPRGDFAWVPPGYTDRLEDLLAEGELVVDPKEWADHHAPFAAEKAEWPTIDNGVEEGGVVVLKDSQGNTKRFPGGKNPLQTMVVKAARHQLTTSAGVLVDMIRQFAPNTDPKFLTFLTGLTSTRYGREIRVGFGVPKDPSLKGYYHYGNDLLTGTGIMMGPFSPHPNKAAKLDAPETLAPTLTEELAHAHTVFSYHHDPVIRAETNRIFQIATEKLKSLDSIGAAGKFTQSTIHGLESPEEMLGAVFKDQDLQDLFRSIKDPGSPLGHSLWDAIARLFRRAFAKIVGSDADSLLASLTQLSTEATLSTIRHADMWGVKHTGDIYAARGKGGKDLIVGKTPQRPEPKSWVEKVSTFLPPYEGGRPPAEPTSEQAVNFGKTAVPENEIDKFSQSFVNPDGVTKTTIKTDEKGPYGRVLESRLPAGEKFFYNLPDFEQDTKGQMRLGKLSVSKKGELPLVALQNAKGWDGRQLSKGELELYKQLVPEAFGGSTVNVKTLVDGLKTKGPVVEVRKLGGSDKQMTNRLQQLIHILDTRGYGLEPSEGANQPNQTGAVDVIRNGQLVERDTLPADIANLVDEAEALGRDATPETGEVGGSKYAFVAPKPESEMPGYVEGLVRVPVAKATEVEARQYNAEYPNASDELKAKVKGTPKYSGPHFGSEDTNVLAFYRGYEETLPDGTKAFHVIEVQSDWGQLQRGIDAAWKREGYKDEADAKAHGKITEDRNHPLLRVYETLALKAAIQHAKEIGATKVILSDAETAMMTEGHDKLTSMFGNDGNRVHVETTMGEPHVTNEGLLKAEGFVQEPNSGDWYKDMPTREDAIKEVNRLNGNFKADPPQAKGMRLHYDQTLPSAMEKLTGSVGEPVVLGTHKSASRPEIAQTREDTERFEAQGWQHQGAAVWRSPTPEGSPVFRDPSGQSKTQITGRAYTIATTPTEGHALFSRTPNTNPQAIVDSMKGHSTHITEDEGQLWFHPYKMDRFRSIFQPALGNQLRLQMQGGQWGFAVGKQAFKQVTQEDLMRMPAPKVRPWAPSAFETMKSIFRKRGDSDESATAQAAYNLSFLSDLKGSERTTWGSLGGEDNYLGIAWYKHKIAGFDEKAAPSFAVVGRHEVGHLGGAHPDYQKLETPDVRTAMDYATKLFAGLSESERQEVLQGLVNVSKETRKLETEPYKDAITDPYEFVAEFMAHAGDLLEASPNPSALVRDFIRFAPDEVGNMVTHINLRRHQAFEVLERQLRDSAVQRGADYNKMLGTVKELTSTFKGLARESMDIALDIAEFYRMRNLYPDMYQPMLKRFAKRLDEFADMPPQGDEPSALLTGRVLESREPQLYKDIKRWAGMDLDERNPEKPSLWTRMVAQFVQFADQHPIARPFYDMLESVQGQEKHAIAQVATLLAGSFEGGKVLDDKRTKQIVQFVKSTRMRDLFSKIGLDVQTEGDSRFREKLSAAEGDVFGVPEIDVMTPEYMDAIYRKYNVSPAERVILDTVFTGTRNQIKAISAKIVQSHFTALETVAATAIQRHTELSPEAARSAAKVLSEAVQLSQDIAAGRSADINKAAELQHQFMQAVPDVKVQGRILQLVESGWEQGRKLERFLSVRMPYYMSERRPGQFGVWWKDDDGKMQRHYFKTSDERAKFIRTKDIEPVRQTDPGDRNYGVDEGVFNYLNEIHEKLVQRLTETFGPEEGNKLGVLMDAATELRNALSARDVLKATTPRKGAPTREYLDMFDVHQHYVRSVLTAGKNRQMKLEAELLLNAAEFANQPIIKNQLNAHLNQVIKPDTELGRLVQAINFTYFMGGNMSSMIIEPFQQLSALAPVLTQHGASIKDGYKYIAQANKAWVESKTRGNRYKEGWIDEMITRARNEGVIDQGILAELEHNQDLAMINRLRATNGLGEWSLFDMLKNRVYQVANLARRFYGVVPAYNSEIAFVASLLHAKAQGKSGEQAFSDARFYTRQAMFGGGKINRPIGLFDLVPRTAAQTMWSLQSYGTSMMTMMGHLIKRSLNPKGLTPAQATQVRKAAVQMLTTQFALAGALGMPFVQIGMLALQKLFPDLKVEQTVRDALANLAGDDDASGGWLGQMLQMGVPTALSGTDFGSRFALSSTLGISPYSDFSFSSFVGPTASVVTNVFKALQAGANGQPAKAVEDLMPRGPLRLWKALEEQNKFMSRSKGTMLADDLSPLERGARAVGFTPARIQRLMDSERLQNVAQEAEKVEQRKWVDRSATDVLAGKDDEVRQSIARRALEAKRDPVDLARSVAKRVEEKLMPQDVRDLGNRATLASQRQIRGVLGEQARTPSQIERMQLQQQILQRLGVPRSMPSARSLSRASALDQLMELYPQLTTSEAKVMLDRTAVRRTPALLEGLLDNGE